MWAMTRHRAVDSPISCGIWSGGLRAWLHHSTRDQRRWPGVGQRARGAVGDAGRGSGGAEYILCLPTAFRPVGAVLSRLPLAHPRLCDHCAVGLQFPELAPFMRSTSLCRKRRHIHPNCWDRQSAHRYICGAGRGAAPTRRVLSAL